MLHVVFVKMKLLFISLKFILFNSQKITKFDRVVSRDSVIAVLVSIKETLLLVLRYMRNAHEP